MRYTVTTFKVRLEVCDQGDRTAASDDVMRVAKPIFGNLDADKNTLFSWRSTTRTGSTVTK